MIALTPWGLCEDLSEGIHVECPGHSKCSVKRADASNGGDEMLEYYARAPAPPHLGHSGSHTPSMELKEASFVI